MSPFQGFDEKFSLNYNNNFLSGLKPGTGDIIIEEVAKC